MPAPQENPPHPKKDFRSEGWIASTPIRLSLMKNLKKLYPGRVGDAFTGNFDYSGFVRDIRKSAILTEEEKDTISTIFNPKSPLANALLRIPIMAEAMLKNRDITTPCTDPTTQALWESVWKETLGHYHKDVERYQNKFHILDEAAYPFATPSLRSFPLKQAFVATNLHFSSTNQGAEFYVSEGFRKLSHHHQKAVMFHEAHHAIHPVLQQRDLQSYKMIKTIKTIISLGGTLRREEDDADDYSALKNNGYDLSNALEILSQNRQKSREARQRHDSVCTEVYAIARQNGLIDINLDIFPEQLKSKFTFSPPGFPSHLIHSYTNYLYHNMHPPLEGRLQRNSTTEWAKQVQKNPGSVLGLK